MSYRERLIEKAALTLYSGNAPLSLVQEAERLVDALLPQVSTVEELESLLVSMSEAGSPTLVIDPRGTAWTLFEDDRGGWWGQRLACEGETQEDATVPVSPPYGTWPQDQDLPLTVVWQPEVDHG